MKNLSGFNFFMPCSRSLHPQLRLLTFRPGYRLTEAHNAVIATVNRRKQNGIAFQIGFFQWKA